MLMNEMVRSSMRKQNLGSALTWATSGPWPCARELMKKI